MSLWYRFCRSLVNWLGRVFAGLTVHGREHVPAGGPLLVTSNHIGLLDPPFIACVFPREVGFAAKKELFAVPILGPVIRSLNAVPVDRAQVSVATIREFSRILDEGKALMYFPEGTRSRTGRLGKPKIGVGMILARQPVTIVPVRIEGTDSLFRCLIRRERVRVTIGPPYTLPREAEDPSDSRRESYRRTAESVMERIRRLEDGDFVTDDRETGPPDQEAARAADGRPAASVQGDSNTTEGMEPKE